MVYDLTSFLIISSVLVCGIAGFGSVIIIFRRVINNQSIFFSLFLIGTTSYVVLYIFLKVEELKYLHYPLQTIAMAILVFGFFMFSYSLKNKEINIKKIGLIIGGILSIIPILCIIFMPFTFIIESYGYELQIETWFLILVAIINLTVIVYASIFLLFSGLKSPSLTIRKKTKIIVFSLLIDVIFGSLFLAVIPILFQAHYVKPFGYYVISISMIIMTYSFKKDEI